MRAAAVGSGSAPETFLIRPFQGGVLGVGFVVMSSLHTLSAANVPRPSNIPHLRNIPRIIVGSII